MKPHASYLAAVAAPVRAGARREALPRERGRVVRRRALAVMFGVNFAAYMRAVDAGDEAALSQAHDLARQGLEKLLGAPVDRLRITSAGLQR